MRRSNSMNFPPEMSDLNVVLLGLSGAGKSSSANTIIGDRRFEEVTQEDRSSSVNKVCTSAQTEADGQKITVIETVGISDTDMAITEAQSEIEQILQSTHIDVFLLVIKLGETFTQEKSKVVKWIKDNIGAEALKHTIVLFTHGDRIQEPVEDHLSKSQPLQSVVDQCSGGFHVFNNRDEDRAQVAELLEKINRLREKNEYSRYTEQDYKKSPGDLLLLRCVCGAAAAVGAGVGAALGAMLGDLGGAGVSGGAGALGGAGAEEGVMMAFSVAPPVGQNVLMAAAGGAVIAALVAGAGVYLLARKYLSRERDKRD